MLVQGAENTHNKVDTALLAESRLYLHNRKKEEVEAISRLRKNKSKKIRSMAKFAKSQNVGSDGAGTVVPEDLPSGLKTKNIDEPVSDGIDFDKHDVDPDAY